MLRLPRRQGVRVQASTWHLAGAHEVTQWVGASQRGLPSISVHRGVSQVVVHSGASHLAGQEGSAAICGLGGCAH